jgi:2-methylcitrate dehydratase PrpD
LRTGVVSAAWANGALAHLLDFDDTGFSHPTACILPATLAMAEESGATGGELVAAVCVGLEVFERMSSFGRADSIPLPFMGVRRRRREQAVSPD